MLFIDEAARIAKPDTNGKHRHAVGMPVVSIKIGDHCHHGVGETDHLWGHKDPFYVRRGVSCTKSRSSRQHTEDFYLGSGRKDA